ncbi:hypothetical protein JTE90_028379 [Oedothorax gibbosus]|uniref:Gustatory receptor n=1 Tax=Oedothorax gibbosus TaxID=931172 RepID=A0AAV6VEE4_9ARAC|nr:hypothetical protein JTE90_028379 [Oedothorax gibbosus]
MTSFTFYHLYLIAVHGTFGYTAFMSTSVTVLPNMIWLYTWKKRTSLEKFLNLLTNKTSPCMKNHQLKPNVVNIFVIFGLIFPPIWQTLVLYSSGNFQKLHFKDLVHQYCGKTHELLFPTISAITYVALCRILVLRLRASHFQLRQIPSTTDPNKIKWTVENFLVVVRAIELFQETFSASIFFLFWHNFSQLSYSMMEALFEKEMYQQSLVLDSVFFVAHVCGVVGTVTVSAAEIPLEMQRIKSSLIKKRFQRMLKGPYLFGEQYTNMILQMDVFVLTACDVFSFNRGFLLTALGALMGQVLIIYQIITN